MKLKWERGNIQEFQRWIYHLSGCKSRWDWSGPDAAQWITHDARLPIVIRNYLSLSHDSVPIVTVRVIYAGRYRTKIIRIGNAL